MKLTFIGAAHEVTGSCTMLTLGDKYYLIDCGMEQGKDVFENIELPVPANELEAVFLTHAHIDHSGMLPKLCKDGFRGTVYSTEATRDLCNIMLRDSAHIQMAEAEWKNRKAKRKAGELIEPVYDINDVEHLMHLFRGCEYDRIITVGEGISIRFNDIGHLLGSAAIEMWLKENGTEKKIVFSGDVGNTNHPLIRDPKTVDGGDYLVIESTYGDRLHERTTGDDTVAELASVIKRAFSRGGSVIIPSFAVGRTQELLYALREAKNKGLLDEFGTFPVYVDSPLAAESTQIFLQTDENIFDEETIQLFNKGENPIWFDGIELSVTADDSKQINFNPNSKIIISASGMCEAGRIRHHLKHNLWRSENIILFVGYQAENSLGRKLLEGATEVVLFGEKIAVKAEICTLHGTSGHADKDGLLNWLNSCTVRPKTVFVNHGDEVSADSFTKTLCEEYGYNAIAPYSGGEYDLITDTLITVGFKKRIEKVSSGRENANSLYTLLLDAANRLLSLVHSYKYLPNKDIQNLTNDINDIIDKNRI